MRKPSGSKAANSASGAFSGHLTTLQEQTNQLKARLFEISQAAQTHSREMETAFAAPLLLENQYRAVASVNTLLAAVAEAVTALHLQKETVDRLGRLAKTPPQTLEIQPETRPANRNQPGKPKKSGT